MVYKLNWPLNAINVVSPPPLPHTQGETTRRVVMLTAEATQAQILASQASIQAQLMPGSKVSLSWLWSEKDVTAGCVSPYSVCRANALLCPRIVWGLQYIALM